MLRELRHSSNLYPYYKAMEEARRVIAAEADD